MDRPPSNAVDALRSTFDEVSSAFSYAECPSVAERQALLASIVEAIRTRQEDIITAVSADFGMRSPAETLSSEIALVIGLSERLRKNLKRLSRPSGRSDYLSNVPGKAYVSYRPKGVVGVIAPWNYPFLLAMSPVITALAAGNRVLLKPSELAPATAAIIEKILHTTCDPRTVRVVKGDAEVGEAFSKLPFDHLFFTGSTRVGRLIAKAAAENLTPLTLELGGKSPAIVLPDADLERATRMLALGKTFNAGQSCVAPDYALVPRGRERATGDAILKHVREFFTDLAESADYSTLLQDTDIHRLDRMVDEAKAAGATVLTLEDGARSVRAKGKMPPTLVLNPPLTSEIMTEEIFGPVMSIIGYQSIDDAIAFVNARPRPLASYVFAEKTEDARSILRQTISGGASINATLLHLAAEKLPFGGIGASGMGRYHGDEGFYEFCHPQSVLEFPKWRWLQKIATPPYGKLFTWMSSRTIGSNKAADSSRR